MTDRTLGHAEAFELLPWLVNGTLRGEERELVDRHVASCLVCRAELRSQSALQAHIENQPTVSWSAESGYERLARRLDAARAPGSSARPPSFASGVVRAFRRPLRIGGVVAITTALVAVAWLGADGDGTRGPIGFTTLTETAAGPPLLVDIVFAEAVTEAERGELLGELGGTIVAGPSEIGRVTVSVSAEHAPPGDRDALITALQADPRVRFAAWNFTLERPDGSP
ncbi:MAG TPA: zf-HC2 domain-containing protein [Gammaproteobacteria bacterium]|nr:zf-HC2 domain-containing protein [Gammaproteobacteria bacterium]